MERSQAHNRMKERKDITAAGKNFVSSGNNLLLTLSSLAFGFNVERIEEKNRKEEHVAQRDKTNGGEKTRLKGEEKWTGPKKHELKKKRTGP